MTIADGEINLLIHALVDGELDAPTAREVEARIALDPKLAKQRDALLALKGAMRRVPKQQPSDALLKKISTIGVSEEKIAQPQFGKPKHFLSRSYGWQALAASVVLTAFLASGTTRFLMLNSVPDSFISAIADDHRRSLLAASPFDVASSDRHTVKPWLDAKLGLSPPAPDLSVQGFALAGGRVEVVTDKPLPALVYRHHEHLISVIAEPVRNGSASDPVDISSGGFSMVKWNDGAFTYWAISDTEWADLNNFATLFKAAAAPK